MSNRGRPGNFDSDLLSDASNVTKYRRMDSYEAARVGATPTHARTNQGGFAGRAAPLALQQLAAKLSFQGEHVNLAQKAGFDQVSRRMAFTDANIEGFIHEAWEAFARQGRELKFPYVKKKSVIIEDDEMAPLPAGFSEAYVTIEYEKIPYTVSDLAT